MAPVPVRRLAGTITPHLTGRPAVLTIADLRTAPDQGLSGAACTTADPDLFFPEPGDTFAERRAKAICAACPVWAACLAGAIDRAEPVGIFGGLNEQERGMPRWREIRESDRPAAVVRVPAAVTGALRTFVADLTQQARQLHTSAGGAA
ncbi:WhiB family transcriptional regulator [Kitasatospora sp. NPDC057223]|uniref:WhiB family transcriptional regulator n=1 Tax=Kitasatospora sp. NPDC057223 TaxID=3346055 RepID=UPI00362D109D